MSQRVERSDVHIRMDVVRAVWLPSHTPTPDWEQTAQKPRQRAHPTQLSGPKESTSPLGTSQAGQRQRKDNPGLEGATPFFVEGAVLAKGRFHQRRTHPKLRFFCFVLFLLGFVFLFCFVLVSREGSSPNMC